MPSESSHQTVKIKFSKKIILEDENYAVIAILSTIPELDSSAQQVSKVYKKEEALQKSLNKYKKIIEFNIDALKPTFHDLIKVNFQVDPTFINIVAEGKQRLTIFPITYKSYIHNSITLINHIILEPILPDSSYQAIILEISKRIIYVEFRDAKRILFASLAIETNANIVPSINTLDYVNAFRPLFLLVKRISSKRLDLSTYAKRSSSTLDEKASVTAGSSEFPEELQLSNVFEKLFGVPVGQLIVVDRPVVIFAEKPSDIKYDYIEFLKRVLRELYLVYQGGLPNPSTISTSFEEVKLKTRAGGQIYTLDLDKALDQEREQEYLRYLVDRLEELYSQGLGYLVLYGTRQTLEKLEKLGLAITHLYLSKVKEETASEIQARKRKLWIIPKPIELKIKENKSLYCIIDFIWGRILSACKDVDTLVSGGIVLDYYAATIEDAYYREITRIAYDPDVNLIVEPSPKDEGELDRESLVHYALKAIAVMHLRDNEEIPESEIYTEYDMGDIVVDVYVKHPKLGDLAIEVETLYGTTLPLLKLRKTIESRLRKGLRTWIIIPSPQFFLFLPWVAKLRRAYRARYRDLLEFFTLDIEQKKLIQFNKIKILYTKIVESAQKL